jgi:hypothetical protein
MARVTWRAVLALAALGSPALCAAPAFRNVGFYHWGGRRTASMSEGVERIARLGGRVARVVLSPRYYRDYHISQSCYAGYSLTAIANEPDVKRALDNESIDVFILTAYDGATLGDCEHTRFLNPPFYTPENTLGAHAGIQRFHAVPVPDLPAHAQALHRFRLGGR